MTNIDGKVHMDWADAVAMLERKLDPARFVELHSGDRLELRAKIADNSTFSSIFLNVLRPTGTRSVFNAHDMVSNRRHMEQIFESLIRRQAHRGTDEIRQWATQVVLDIDASGRFEWEVSS
jgi:hypothetical protein